MTILSSNCPPRPLHPTFIVLRYINMDDPQPNHHEIQAVEASTPKPPVIATIEACQLAYTKWNEAESKRLEMLASAKQTNTPTAEYTQPIPKSEEVTKSEELSALALKTKSICDNAFGEGAKPEAFDALITELTDGSPATPERVIQAGAVIENISYYRRNPNKAGEVLQKYPEALYLPNVQSELQEVVFGLTRSVENLRTAATTEPEDPQNTSKLLEVATSETSPLKKSSKDQLKDTLDLVRGARAQQLVDSLEDPSINEPKAALLKENHLVLISKITGVSLDQTSLQDALNQHKKLLVDRKIITSDYQPPLSRINFGEALAALSQRTEDLDKKRHLEALALGYATATKFEPGRFGQKAGDVLMALMLNTKDPEARAYVAVQEAGRNQTDILAQQKSRVYRDVLNHSEQGINSLFDVQNRAALGARDERTAVEEARAEAEKVKADELTAQARAEADRLAAEATAATPIKGTPTIVTPAAKKGIFDRLLGR